MSERLRRSLSASFVSPRCLICYARAQSHEPPSDSAGLLSFIIITTIIIVIVLSFNGDTRIYDNSLSLSLLYSKEYVISKSRKSIIVIRWRGAPLIRENIVELHGA